MSFADQPISLANAFEQPVKPAREGGFLHPSTQRLGDYWTRVNRAYGLSENARAFAVGEEMKLGDKPAFASLREIEAWIENDGQA